MDEINQPPDPISPTPEQPTYVTPVPPFSSVAVSSFYKPTQDERTFAILAHALQMPGSFIAPLVILLTKKESKFVRFHATQVLLLQALHIGAIVTVMVIMFAVLFGSIASAAQTGSTAKPELPVARFVFMPFMWLIMFGFFVLILVLTIMFSIGRQRRMGGIPGPRPPRQVHAEHVKGLESGHESFSKGTAFS